LIDLRGSRAFEAAHLPGSSRLDPSEVHIPYLRSPRRRPLLLLWRAQAERDDAIEALHASGYTVLPLDAPLSEWPGPWEEGPERTPAWEPSRLVAEWAGRVSPGAVVDLACGSGRDAVYLAMQGHRVTAIDHLQDALAQAEALAARHGVALDLHRADLEEDSDCWGAAWSMIHVHRFLHRPSLPLFCDRLQDGGLLLYETFLEQQASSGKRPQNPRHLLRAGELLRSSKGLSVIRYHEGVNEDGDWVASLVARKRRPA
jgi:SAM-dependent methyltransferase